jgi:hypothetical protein
LTFSHRSPTALHLPASVVDGRHPCLPRSRLIWRLDHILISSL